MAKTKNNKLNTRQKLFVEHYVANGFNGTQAAISAGYAPKNADITASKLLTMPKVQTYLSKRIKQVLGSTDTLSVQLISKLKDIAFSNLSDVAEWNKEDGLVLKDSNILDEPSSYSISEISSKYNKDSESYDFKIKQVDKTKAIDMLAKFVALYEQGKPEDEKETESIKLTKQERTNKLLEYQEKLKSLKK